MGTNCAVNLAEICLSYLETQAGLDPKIYRRYIDDGILVVTKSNASNEILNFNQTLNNLDPKIVWTPDFDTLNPHTVFLDLQVQYRPVTIFQYHKPTKKLTFFVPYRSLHRKHTINNIPVSLFNRAETLNLDEKSKMMSFQRIELGLIGLGYPNKLILEAHTQSSKIVPKRRPELYIQKPVSNHPEPA